MIYEYIPLSYILIYFLVINLIGFVSMYIDKRKAKKGGWRTPEKTLLTIALAGGSIGSLCGMYKFRHKTKHARFKFGIPAFLVIHIVLIVYLKVKGIL